MFTGSVTACTNLELGYLKVTEGMNAIQETHNVL